MLAQTIGKSVLNLDVLTITSPCFHASMQRFLENGGFFSSTTARKDQNTKRFHHLIYSGTPPNGHPLKIRTPGYYGQFRISRRIKSSYVFSKVIALHTDTRIIWTIRRVPLVSLLTVFSLYLLLLLFLTLTIASR